MFVVAKNLFLQFSHNPSTSRKKSIRHGQNQALRKRMGDNGEAAVLGHPHAIFLLLSSVLNMKTEQFFEITNITQRDVEGFRRSHHFKRLHRRTIIKI